MGYKIKDIVMWFSCLDIANLKDKYGLIDIFGGIENLWNCPFKDIVKKTNRPTAIKIDKSRKDFDRIKSRTDELKMRFIGILDEDYPKKLKGIPYAPFGFFIYGCLPSESRKSAAIIGSRRITEYGRVCTSEISSELAKNGIVIISGLADGVDGIAHSSALNVRGGTVAVMGSGLNVVYPKRNKELYDKIISAGNCIISEYPPDSLPLSYHFPLRNRIISGLSDIVVVTEAAERSGSLITASYAIEQGREVYAVPGNIDSIFSRGCNKLIRDGANILCDVSDILHDLGIYGNYNAHRLKPDNKTEEPSEDTEETLNKINESEISEKKSKNLNLELEPFEKMVYDCIGYENITLDEVLEKTELSIQEAQLYLTFLESKSLIQSSAGQYKRI